MRSIITDLRAARATTVYTKRASQCRVEEAYAFKFCCRRLGHCRPGLERRLVYSGSSLVGTACRTVAPDHWHDDCIARYISP